jgi:hypothetical protein
VELGEPLERVEVRDRRADHGGRRPAGAEGCVGAIQLAVAPRAILGLLIAQRVVANDPCDDEADRTEEEAEERSRQSAVDPVEHDAAGQAADGGADEGEEQDWTGHRQDLFYHAANLRRVRRADQAERPVASVKEGSRQATMSYSQTVETDTVLASPDAKR